MTVFIGVGLVAREIDRRSIYSLLAKPLPRWEFIVGKYFGLVLTIVVNVAAMTVALYADARVDELDARRSNVRLSWDAPALDPRLLIAVLLIVAELALLTAIALFFSTFSSSALLSVVFTLGIFVAGPRERRPAQLRRHRRRAGHGARSCRRSAGSCRRSRRSTSRTQVVHGIAGAGRLRAARRCSTPRSTSASLLGGGRGALLAPGVQVSARARRLSSPSRSSSPASALAAAVLRARETRYPLPPPTERLLYLRSGKVARPR